MIRRWIWAALELSISCLVIAQQSASQGQGRRFGRTQGMWRIPGPTRGSALKLRKKSPMSSSTATANRIRSTAIPSSGSPAGARSSGGVSPANGIGCSTLAGSTDSALTWT